jgi:hypothetical protein
LGRGEGRKERKEREKGEIIVFQYIYIIYSAVFKFAVENVNSA